MKIDDIDIVLNYLEDSDENFTEAKRILYEERERLKKQKNVGIVALREYKNENNYFIVDDDTINWILSTESGRPDGGTTSQLLSDQGGSSWIDQCVPKSVAAQLVEAYREKDGTTTFEGVTLTSGSWQNDRALYAESICIEVWDDLQDAFNSITKQKFHVIGMFSGWIY